MGVSSISHNQPMTHFQHFHIMNLTNNQNIFLKGMWLAMIWEIWARRNRVIFSSKKGR